MMMWLLERMLENLHRYLKEYHIHSYCNRSVFIAFIGCVLDSLYCSVYMECTKSHDFCRSFICDSSNLSLHFVFSTLNTLTMQFTEIDRPDIVINSNNNEIF